MSKQHGSFLDELESESIFILREVYAEFKRPVILFSGGKDSIVLTHLSKKAFDPLGIPFSLLHIDTGHNFPEAIEFRDRLVGKEGVDLIVGSVQKSIDDGLVVEQTGPDASRNTLQIRTLLDTIQELEIDCAIGGARRDEERSRAKERFFSHRNKTGEWNPKNQRPEIWKLFNTKQSEGEHFRVFPISNWTELDVWSYIARENIDLPSLYFSEEREVIRRNNTWIQHSDLTPLRSGEQLEKKRIRFRTLGDITITGGIESEAANLDEIVKEVAQFRISERGNRMDDKVSQNAMEERKRKGYF